MDPGIMESNENRKSEFVDIAWRVCALKSN